MNVAPITFIETPFHEKFGVPRQSLLVHEAVGKMFFPKDDYFLEAFRGIEECGYLWLIFQFHLIEENMNKALIRPPRYENKIKKGVYATRTPHRINRLGLSLVKFDCLNVLKSKILLQVRGIDLVTGTPILDIKPYVPYSDQFNLSVAKESPYAHSPELHEIQWLCEKLENDSDVKLIEKIISLDPRPAGDKNIKKDKVMREKKYGVAVAGYNVRFRFVADLNYFEILSVKKLKVKH